LFELIEIAKSGKFFAAGKGIYLGA